MARTAFLIFEVYFSLCYGIKMPSNIEFNLWTESISRKVLDLALEETDVKVLNEAYSKENMQDQAKLHAFSGAYIADTAMKELGDMFGRRKEAVQTIAKHAEQIAARYSHKYELEHEDLRYVNVKHIGRHKKELEMESNMHPVTKITNISLEYSEKFKRPVNFSLSGVHIPLDVYEGWMWHRYKPAFWQESPGSVDGIRSDIEVLNALNWTEKLDSVFKQNQRQDPSLYWQYFASSYGLLRIHPAFRWTTVAHVPDLYDARKRLWFAQTLSSPKDIIILLDASGSIHGPSFEIMKITVKTILGTLGENDFFNVAQFTMNATWLVPCFSSLVQATSANKQIFHEAIDLLTPGDKENYGNALKFAYESFISYQRKSSHYDGAGCNRAMFLLSDGGTQHPTEIMKKYSKDPQTSDIRVFTIAVGPHPIPTVNLRQIACLGKGHFSAIMTIGAIRSKTQEYLRILGKPLALSYDDQLLHWSSTYEDAGGLGPTVSITRPVFDVKKEPNQEQQLLGIAGTDIPISEIESIILKKKMGKNVYTFALSPNGMVLYHPSLADYTNVLEDPLLFDILDLEPDNPEIESIRKAMIDRQSGFKVVEVPFFSGDYAYRERRTYHYRPIGNSTYSFCLVVPEKYLRMDVEPTKKTNNNTLLDLYARDVLREKNASLLIAPWAQCSFGNSLRISRIEGQNGITHVFDRTLNNCDSSVVQHLYWDLDVALSAVKSWHKQGKGSSRFIATQGGLAFVQNQRSSFVSSSLSDIHKDAIYQRISRADTNVIAGIVSKQDDGKLKVKSVIGSRVLLTHELSNLTQILAAVGVELPPYIFRRIMFDETIQNEKSLCNNKEEINCFLLDEAAQVVASNREDISLGSFLGSEEADPQLMAALASGVTNVYDQVVQHRPLASCKKWVNSNQCSSAGILPTLSVVHSSVARVVVSLVVNTFVFIQHCLTSVFIVIFPLVGIREVDGGNALTDIGLDFLRPPKITTRLCSTRSASYRLILNSESETVRASLACPGTSLETVEILNDTNITKRSFQRNGNIINAEKGECRREILAKRIPELNLLLVVTQAACPCSSTHEPLLDEPIEESEIKVCNSRGRYRRKLALCYATDPKEKFQECNIPQSSSGWNLCNTHFISFLLLTLLFVCY